MINFPLYKVRKYERIFVEGNYKIIETAKSRYVLDILGQEHKTYGERRLDILRDQHKTYRIYPLEVRISSISQLLKQQHKTYIDSTGKLIEIKKTKFYDVERYRIVHVEPKGTYYIVRVAGTSSAFRLESLPDGCTHIYCVKFGKSLLFYSFDKGQKPPRRVKL